MFNYIYVDTNKFTINCSVCNNNNYLHFDYNTQTNQYICMECGAILPNMSFADLVAYSKVNNTENIGMEDNIKENTNTNKVKVFKFIYNYMAYIMEQLSAACMQESNINEKDTDKIRNKYELCNN
jgi:hypothetical protein